MPDDAPPEQAVWPKGWEGHRRAQLLRMARLPFSQKLDWLDQANRLVRHIQQHRSRSKPSDVAPEGSP